MEKFGKYIKTAEFAALCHVSKQTLIYYDRIGLFTPHHVDGKGYRYYVLEQHEIFSLIMMLAELNTPLNEIREYLADKSIPSFLDLLERKEQEAIVKIQKLEQISHMIHYQKESIRRAEEINDYNTVFLEREPEEYLIVSRVLHSNEEEEFARIYSDLIAYSDSLEIGTFGIGGIVNRKDLTDEFSYVISRLYTKTSSPQESALIKTAGQYAVSYHKGSYQNTSEAYERILSFISDRGLHVAGDAYEEDLLNSYTQKKEEEYLIRISIPVESITVS